MDWRLYITRLMIGGSDREVKTGEDAVKGILLDGQFGRCQRSAYIELEVCTRQ